MHQTIKQQQPKIQQTDDKSVNFQQIITQSVSGLQKIIVSKIESTIQHFVEEKNEKIEANKEAIANMLKEVVLLKNLCDDISKKTEQFPHFVARNSDFKKMESAMLSELKIIKDRPLRDNTMEFEMLRMQMMKFGIWCENILSQLSDHRNDCSIYVIIYTLAQIAFCTFAYNAKPNGNDELTKSVLSDIQSRALIILDGIERDTESKELDKHTVIESVIEWMQRILSDEEEQNENIWIARTGHAMAHFCNREVSVNDKLNGMKDKLEIIASGQSKACLKMSIFQPLIGVCSVSFVLFCLWLQALTREQNDFW